MCRENKPNREIEIHNQYQWDVESCRSMEVDFILFIHIDLRVHKRQFSRFKAQMELDIILSCLVYLFIYSIYLQRWLTFGYLPTYINTNKEAQSIRSMNIIRNMAQEHFWHCCPLKLTAETEVSAPVLNWWVLWCGRGSIIIPLSRVYIMDFKCLVLLVWQCNIKRIFSSCVALMY